MARCISERFRDRDINPRPIGKVRQGGYFIPNCPDYEPRIDLPKKVKVDEIFTGWHYRNCKYFRTR